MDPTIQARLRERQEDRKAASEKRKAEREETQRVEESADYFAHQFIDRKKGTAFTLHRNDVLNLYRRHLVTCSCHGSFGRLGRGTTWSTFHSFQQFSPEMPGPAEVSVRFRFLSHCLHTWKVSAGVLNVCILYFWCPFDLKGDQNNFQLSLFRPHKLNF